MAGCSPTRASLKSSQEHSAFQRTGSYHNRRTGRTVVARTRRRPDRAGSSTDRRGCAEPLVPLTEAGDAEHFACEFGDKVRFDYRRGRWLVFMGHRWVPDPDGELQRLALKAMRLRQMKSLGIQDSGDRKKHFKWALQGESRSRIQNMLALAQSMPPIRDSGDNWDSNPWKLGVENGVVNLRTGGMRKGRPEDRITMSTRAPYDPAATCPLWERTVSEIFGGDWALIDYVQRALGYSLTGMTHEQCLFMNWGDGANGKGTLINTVAWELGDYADDLPFSALELKQRASIPNDVAKLVDKRFVTSSETSGDVRLNEARIKALTGCDPITARFMHRNFFTFQPAAKFWLATNHKPVVQDTSYGFWRRIRLVPFTQRFTGKQDDRTLKEKLKAEAPGILRWLVDGCLKYQKKGLNPPRAVQDATKTYEKESDPLSEFFKDCCVIAKNRNIAAQDLYRAYGDWCENGGGERMSQRRFGPEIRNRFPAEERSHRVTYFGIGLRKSETGTAPDPSTHRDPSSRVSSRSKRTGKKPKERVKKGPKGPPAGSAKVKGVSLSPSDAMPPSNRRNGTTGNGRP